MFLKQLIAGNGTRAAVNGRFRRGIRLFVNFAVAVGKGEIAAQVVTGRRPVHPGHLIWTPFCFARASAGNNNPANGIALPHRVLSVKFADEFGFTLF